MALEEHVHRVLNTNEFYLNHMRDEYEQTYTRTPGMERLFRQIRLDPILAAGIVDNKGDFVFLSGPSGAGKTTLLKLMYAAMPVQRGQVSIAGVNVHGINTANIPHLRRQVGVVFQDFRLF